LSAYISYFPNLIFIKANRCAVKALQPYPTWRQGQGLHLPFGASPQARQPAPEQGFLSRQATFTTNFNQEIKKYWFVTIL